MKSGFLQLESTLYNIFEQSKRDVNDVSKFFYIIDGGMILHRLKRQTAKIKIDLLMFFAKNCTENNFQRSQAESDGDLSPYKTILMC
jgi:hypothetical protein